jgi:2-oxoisovalerate dehydrogenase E1 component
VKAETKARTKPAGGAGATAGRKEPRSAQRHALNLLQTMLLIRRFEERAAELYQAGKIRGFLHLYIGEEAAGAGVMQVLTDDDNVVATYREHGHALARGLPAGCLMAEMYGKANGCSRGRGGSMHFFDAERRFFGGYAIVGGGLPVAIGLALADKMRGDRRITACFFGEGAVAEGEFHESMNLAQLWGLPVLFLCENNLYAMGTAYTLSESQTDLMTKAQGYRWKRRRAPPPPGCAKGRVPTCWSCAPIAFAATLWPTRSSTGPRTKSSDGASTTRSMVSSSSFASGGSSRTEVWAGSRPPWRSRSTRPWRMPKPAPGKRWTISRSSWRRGDAMTTMTYREAVRSALREALRNDPRVFLIGEDVGRYGGAFAVTHGLLEEFGPERVRDAPLSESAFVGAGVGAAINGMRPVVEVMTVNFSLLAMDQILNNAATLRYMSGGQISVPLVVRMATGGGRQLGAQHSHSLEGWYASIPGIRVLAPATAADARGMVLAALQEEDPVFIFEHATLYPLEEDIDDTAGPADIDRAAVRRQGSDVSIVTYGGSLAKALAAADQLKDEGIEAEVIDLRVLRPLDMATVLTSVGKTHRAVVVDEGWRTVSIAAEISAQIVEHALDALDWPVERVCSAEVPMPYARHMEDAALPQPATIVATVREMFE